MLKNGLRKDAWKLFYILSINRAYLKTNFFRGNREGIDNLDRDCMREWSTKLRKKK